MNEIVRLISFYLPQFHPIPENDRWWGKGFTDWRNVTRATPVFPGHYQPHLPADLGLYDLRVPEVREAQAALASEYGIFGFCYHYYWFGGHRLLERPFNEVLASSKPDLPFCLCWANENWTRRWDGREHEILIQQQHSDEDDINFIHALFPAFEDKRYIRVNGRPLLIVYRTDLLPNPVRTAMIWREEMRKAGHEDLYLCRAETFTSYDENNTTDPQTVGFDAALEFPPHGIWSSKIQSAVIQKKRDFNGQVFDYEQVVYGSLMRPKPSYKLFRGVMPSWDNTPRKPRDGFIFINSSPELYQEWLADCVRWTRHEYRGDERLVFINAWNEWAEGCHLEPDLKHGHRYLEATRAALQADDQLLKALKSQPIFSRNRIDPEMLLDSFSAYVSDVFRENILLRLQLHGREAGPYRIGGQTPKSPGFHIGYLGDVPLLFFLSHYLRSDRPKLRRIRKLIYYVLSALWRTPRTIIHTFSAIFSRERSGQGAKIS